ncbi:HAD family hydrolase [Nocardia terpenica]|uniref:HAD-IA family hydrolase n=1 Tax=Nocardia terpenica TaxID=455432 RepID=A0A6G9YYY2_9NOCA|nr:HAD-IA family hydrolase [Nocardia terpenica]QIS18549.1 HAD-IA family hydrolase [Nocardia terpenica]
MQRRAFGYAALFDLDGVIIDTRSATKDALRALASAWSTVALDPITLDSYVTLPPVDALAALGVTDARRVYRDHFDEALSTAVGSVRVFDAVVSGMAALVEQGAGLGIITAQARSRLRFLLPRSVAELVDIVIAHEDAPAKPAPDGVLTACVHLGVPPGHAFFVGDTPTDVAAGSAAGVLTVGAAWGFGGASVLAGADIVLARPDQVGPELLTHLGGRPFSA